jgi:antitoxin (DNA-binding transcriptional repressor) of toxin-antitoxin stability system
MSVSDARAALPDILSRVENGAEVTITRHGRPVAVIVRPDVLRSRRAQPALEQARRVHELLQTAREHARPTAGGISGRRADELIADIRSGREAP